MTASIKVFLRITQHFNDIFWKHQDDLTALIFENIKEQVGASAAPNIGQSQIKELSKKIFYELCIMNYFAVIKRSASSLCSIELVPIMKVVSQALGTPLSRLIYRQSVMLHDKNIDIDLLSKEIQKMNQLEKRLLSVLIVEHCYMNKVEYRDRQKISNLLNISEKQLMIATAAKV